MLTSIIAPSQLQAMVQLAGAMPEGAFAEIGVFGGGSAYLLYQVARLQGRELHLFDTFTGTPFFIDGLDKHKIDDEFANPLAPARIRDVMPEAKLHVGVYPETHPQDMPPVAFIHCDCDQYESYIAVLDHMWPLVVKGGAILFDDYPYLAGAKKAVEERFELSDLKQCGQRAFVVKH